MSVWLASLLGGSMPGELAPRGERTDTLGTRFGVFLAAWRTTEMETKNQNLLVVHVCKTCKEVYRKCSDIGHALTVVCLCVFVRVSKFLNSLSFNSEILKSNSIQFNFAPSFN